MRKEVMKLGRSSIGVVPGIGAAAVELPRIRTGQKAGLATIEAFDTCIIDGNVDVAVIGEPLWGVAGIASVSARSSSEHDPVTQVAARLQQGLGGRSTETHRGGSCG